MANRDCFDTFRIPEIQKQMESVDDMKAPVILSLGLREPTLILVIAIILGWDRLFLDDIGLGILKIITCQGLGVWWLIDIFTARRRTLDYNFRKFTEAMMFAK